MTAADRAFGWPAGSVRALTTLGSMVGLFMVATVAYVRGGIPDALQLVSVLGPLTGINTAMYFGMRRN